METEHNIEYVKYLGAKVFSNRRYSIHVMLFEQGMARVGMRYKKRKNWWLLRRWGSPGLYFDECRRESVYDTWDCLNYLMMDKTARKWFRKVLHPCIERFLLPNGVISSEIAEEIESKERQQQVEYRLPEMI
ncbi:MAG: hypothetical protein J6035_08325 [Bacteroidaceae bacterium]|nr:hypothetical protein [Bacteroidaceae bacterium]